MSSVRQINQEKREVPTSRIELLLTDRGWHDSLHDSIGPSIHQAAKFGDRLDFDTSQYQDVFGIDPVIMDYAEEGFGHPEFSEDWILSDRDGQSIMIQGKSFGSDDDLEHYLNQIDAVSGTLDYRQLPRCENITGYFVVCAEPSGIMEPRQDFPLTEKGIKYDLGDRGMMKLQAKVYEIDPEFEKVESGFALLD